MALNFGQDLFRPSDYSKIFINYSFTEALTQIGYITYYPLIIENETCAAENILISEDLQSLTTSKTFYQNGDTTGFFDWTKVIDEDYDITLKNSATLLGKAILNFYTNTIIVDNDTNSSIYWIIRIRKWDGTTETEIAYATTPTLNKSSDGTRNYMIGIDIPKTFFKKEDTIRITIEGWGKLVASIVSGDAITLTYYLDKATSKSTKINLPFKIEE